MEITYCKMSSSITKPVLVTGGSGFLGSWCVKILLDRGFMVHTTVRNEEKAQFLRNLPGATERLRIFPGVDLLEDGSFDDAMKGCECVLHTASPFYMVGGTEESLVVPAVTGTRNVLNSCRKHGVSKVVLTSSTAAVYVTYGTVPVDHVYTGCDWSPEDLLREHSNWYCLSKTKAEALAWEMSREDGCPYQLAVMNPTLILGPQLPGQPHLNTSSAVVVGFMDGGMSEIENSCKSIVDVRDVALAHVAALEHPEAFGHRFLLVGGSPHMRDIAEAVRRALPEELQRHVPTAISDKLPPAVMAAPPPHPVLYDVSPSEQILGLSYVPVEEMIRTAVDSLLQNGFTSRSMYSTDKL